MYRILRLIYFIYPCFSNLSFFIIEWTKKASLWLKSIITQHHFNIDVSLEDKVYNLFSNPSKSSNRLGEDNPLPLEWCIYILSYQFILYSYSLKGYYSYHEELIMHNTCYFLYFELPVNLDKRLVWLQSFCGASVCDDSEVTVQLTYSSCLFHLIYLMITDGDSVRQRTIKMCICVILTCRVWHERNDAALMKLEFVISSQAQAFIRFVNTDRLTRINCCVL